METRAGEKFRLKKIISGLEAERQQVEEELNDLETKLRDVSHTPTETEEKPEIGVEDKSAKKMKKRILHLYDSPMYQTSTYSTLKKVVSALAPDFQMDSSFAVLESLDWVKFKKFACELLDEKTFWDKGYDALIIEGHPQTHFLGAGFSPRIRAETVKRFYDTGGVILHTIGVSDLRRGGLPALNTFLAPFCLGLDTFETVNTAVVGLDYGKSYGDAKEFIIVTNQDYKWNCTEFPELLEGVSRLAVSDPLHQTIGSRCRTVLMGNRTTQLLSQSDIFVNSKILELCRVNEWGGFYVLLSSYLLEDWLMDRVRSDNLRFARNLVQHFIACQEERDRKQGSGVLNGADLPEASAQGEVIVKTMAVTRPNATTMISPEPEDPVYCYDSMPWHNPHDPALKKVGEGDLGENREIDLLLITATKTELNQVLHRLKPPRRQNRLFKVSKDYETYYVGRFGTFPAAVTMSSAKGSGRPLAAAQTTRSAIDFWKPVAVVMIGIAFGADRQKHQPADVLVVEQLIPYEGQRVGERKIFRDPISPSGLTLLNRFKNIVGWQFKRPDGSDVSVHYGRILSGEKTINDPDFKRELIEEFPEAIGGEMEGVGVFAACTRAKVEWILVKAVCDWADGKKHDGYQEMAAAAATSLAHFVFSDRNALDGLIKPLAQ